MRSLLMFLTLAMAVAGCASLQSDKPISAGIATIETEARAFGLLILAKGEISGQPCIALFDSDEGNLIVALDGPARDEAVKEELVKIGGSGRLMIFKNSPLLYGIPMANLSHQKIDYIAIPGGSLAEARGKIATIIH